MGDEGGRHYRVNRLAGHHSMRPSGSIDWTNSRGLPRSAAAKRDRKLPTERKITNGRAAHATARVSLVIKIQSNEIF
jgi:hypothetical protein